MRPHSRLTILLIAAALTLLPSATLAQALAEAYPTKPVRVIVPTSPGGAIDTQGRLLAQKLSESLRQTFIVENRAGAGSTIGIGYVAKSTADGYTLLATSPSFTFSPAVYKNLPYDPEKGFSPVSFLAKSPYLLVVHPSLPARSVKEWVALARARPGQLNAGVPHGAFAHLATLWLAESAKIRLQLVPYKGTGPVVIDLMAGELHMTFANVLSTLPYVKLGKLRGLAVSTVARSAVLPNIPTIAEAVPGFELYSWHGWLAPMGTPPAIISKLSGELAQIVKSPEIVKVLSDDGGEPVGSTPEQFRQLISTEIDRWRKVVVKSNMKVQ